jgi:hypothetical protein
MRPARRLMSAVALYCRSRRFPPCRRERPTDSVPVTLGPDDAHYLAELTGLQFAVGAASMRSTATTPRNTGILKSQRAGSPHQGRHCLSSRNDR